MFKINLNDQKKERIIKPEDLLPKTVENTQGELKDFQPLKLVESLVQETGLSQKEAEKVTTNVLRRISSLGLDFIAAPHIRELICGELTAEGLHKFRNHYTRLGMPIYDIKTMIERVAQRDGSYDPMFFYLWIIGQVVEQYVHLDELTESASLLIDHITKDAEKLPEEERKIILNSLDNSLRLLKEKKNQ